HDPIAQRILGRRNGHVDAEVARLRAQFLPGGVAIDQIARDQPREILVQLFHPPASSMIAGSLAPAERQLRITKEVSSKSRRSFSKPKLSSVKKVASSPASCRGVSHHFM